MDLVDVLLEVLERDASDLHLTVGSPPIIRINGVLERLDYPRLSANDTRELIYSILSQDQRQRLENEWEIDFSYSVPGRARFRRGVALGHLERWDDCRKDLLALEKAESIGRHHVVKIAFAAADRAIAFADPGEVRANLELNAAAVARTAIGTHCVGGGHGPPLSV